MEDLKNEIKTLQEERIGLIARIKELEFENEQLKQGGIVVSPSVRVHLGGLTNKMRDEVVHNITKERQQNSSKEEI